MLWICFVVGRDYYVLVCRLSISMAEPPSAARKRKRVELDVTDTGARSLVHESRSASDYSVSTTWKDVLEISEANPDAKFIKISNTSADKVWHSFNGRVHSYSAKLSMRLITWINNNYVIACLIIVFPCSHGSEYWPYTNLLHGVCNKKISVCSYKWPLMCYHLQLFGITRHSVLHLSGVAKWSASLNWLG